MRPSSIVPIYPPVQSAERPSCCVFFHSIRFLFVSVSAAPTSTRLRSLLSGGAGLRIVLVVVAVGIGGVLRGGRLGAQHVRVTAVVVSGVHLEAGLLVVVVLEDLLQRDDSGNGQGDLADDERLSGDGSQSLQAQGSSDAHGGQQGSHNVTAVLLASLVSTTAAAAAASELLLAWTGKGTQRRG